MSTERNRLRWRAIAVSRAFRELFRPSPHAQAWWRVAVRLAAWLMASPGTITAWSYRVVFFADGRTLRRAAEHVLADLRDYSFADKSAFDPDALVMARRQGRRDVWLRISNYLNLDEAQVQALMEIDDGIGG